MNNFSKNKFIFIIDNYHEYMNFHELINLYFKILDNIYPNYIHKINNKDVYNRLYSKRNITKNTMLFKTFVIKKYSIYL